jgi:hypothetical protein
LIVQELHSDCIITFLKILLQVVDEADKAPLHVTCILKTLVESGEMMLSDGRRIVSRPDLFKDDDVIVMHEDFRMIVLANRPGFAFLHLASLPITGELGHCPRLVKLSG